MKTKICLKSRHEVFKNVYEIRLRNKYYHGRKKKKTVLNARLNIADYPFNNIS